MTNMTVPIQRSDFGYLDVTVSDRQRLEATMIAETEKVQARAYLLRVGAEDDLFKALGLAPSNSEQDRATVFPDSAVHDHGPAEGRGIDCGERRLASGRLRGACLPDPQSNDSDPIS